MMNFFTAIIFGVVEGLTEFLPISSTGHLIITARLLHIAHSDFVKTFEIAIQAGAICAVAALYWKKILGDFDTLKKVGLAFLPTAVLGLVCYKIIKQYLLGNATIVLVSLCAGGVLLILFEYWYRTRRTRAVASEAISYSQAFLIGICQAVAFIPGVSRAAATIVGGLALGLGRNTIVEFSFLLAIPTMLAATALDLLKTRAQLTGTEVGYMIAGFAVSCVVAVASIKFFIRFIQRHDFIAFGIYRIVAALVLWRVIR